MEKLSEINALVFSIFVLVASLFAREMLAAWRERGKEMNNTNVDIAKLQGRIESIESLASNIPKLQRDVDAAHNFIREIQGKEPSSR
jgi:hypothetical protein